MLVRFLGEQAGVSLIELVVSLTLLGLVGVGLALGLSTASLAVAQVQERNQAANLAGSQLEIIKNSAFISTTVLWPYPTPAQIPSGYTVTYTAVTTRTLTTPTNEPYQTVIVTASSPAGGIFGLSGLKTRVTP